MLELVSRIYRYKKKLFFVLLTTLLINTLAPLMLPLSIKAASNPTSRIGWVSDEISTDAPNNRRMVRTSDGTLHLFGATLTGAMNVCDGILTAGPSWFMSTDNGNTWTCQDIIDTNNSRYYYAAAVTDNNDNIYLIYSGENIAYRKFTKGSGSTWEMENAQVIVEGNGSNTHSYAVVEIEDETRLWFAYRHFGENKSVRAYYSDNLSSSPTWNLSAELDTPDASSLTHRPAIVRYGPHIGVLYTAYDGQNSIQWRHRSDGDDLNSWSPAETITTTTSTSSSFAVTVDNNEHIHLVYGAAGTSNNTIVTYRNFDGSTWSSPLTISGAGHAGGHSPSITTDGTNIWIFYQGRHRAGVGISTVIGRVVYRKGTPPFESADFENEVVLNTSDRAYNKVFTHANGIYTDVSALSNGPGGVPLVSEIDDAVYFGLTEKYRSISGIVNSRGTEGTLTYEYWDGSEWTTLTTFSTYNPNFANFALDYEINFAPPTDWAETELDNTNAPGTYYYTRARVTTPYATTPNADDFWAYPRTGPIQLLKKSIGGILPIAWYETSPFTVGAGLIQFNSFSINNSPLTPSSLEGQINGDYTNDNSPTFTFTLSDPDESDTVGYRIQVDDSSDFSSPITDYTSALENQGVNSFTVGQIAGSGNYSTGSQGQKLSDGSYYWRVKTIDSSSSESSYTTANSGNVAFIIDTTTPSIPGTPTTASPTNNTAPKWTWNASTDTGSDLSDMPYILQWSQDPTFITDVKSATIEENSYTHTTPLPGGTWNLRVKAIDAAGNESAYSMHGTVIISTSAPTGSITINLDAVYTNDTSATLSIFASDEFDDDADLSMILSENSDFSGANYEAYTPSKIWTFSDLLDGIKTIYIKFRNSLNNESPVYSDSITLDQTEPNAFSLENPRDNTYTNNERPTFRWKVADTEDKASKLSKYKLRIDNGDSGDFSIDNIPVSRTTDLETDSYIIRYENFSDSDTSNNYISVHTKSSSSWSSGKNNGKLKEGRINWSVSAIDNAGNIRTETHTIFLDRKGPEITLTQVDNSLQSPPLRTTSISPRIFGTITDSLTGDIEEKMVVSGPSHVEVIIEKENASGIYIPHSTRTLIINENYWENTHDKASRGENSSAKWSPFSLEFPEPLAAGTYRLQLTGRDFAGNTGPYTTATLLVANTFNETTTHTNRHENAEITPVKSLISPTPSPAQSSTQPGLALDRKHEESFSLITQVFNVFRSIWESIQNLFSR